MARVTDPHPDPLTDLLPTLDLEELGSAQVSVQPRSLEADPGVTLPDTFAEDVTLFRGRSQRQPHGRVFGGQVLAQGVVASGRTVAGVGDGFVGGGEREQLEGIAVFAVAGRRIGRQPAFAQIAVGADIAVRVTRAIGDDHSFR